MKPNFAAPPLKYTKSRYATFENMQIISAFTMIASEKIIGI